MNTEIEKIKTCGHKKVHTKIKILTVPNIFPLVFLPSWIIYFQIQLKSLLTLLSPAPLTGNNEFWS